MLKRFYDNLDRHLEKNKVLVIYGPRQVGKTTLLKKYLSQAKYKYRIDSGDNVKIRNILSSQDFSRIIEYASGYGLIAIDEAQRIPEIGVGLKVLTDQIKNIRIIATGSSSFELAGQIGEPLTGRKKTIILFPLANIELLYSHTPFEIKEKLEDLLIFGSYPAIITAKSKNKKIDALEEIVNSYLLKDILELDKIKSSKVVFDLLRMIAFQVGSEVSLTELAQKVGIDYKTVAKYLDLMEKSFVLYNLRGYSRNLRNELFKKSKYYFYDNGIRNTIISSFNAMELRDDAGKLWENFLVSERLKIQQYKNIYSNNYFWRTWDKKEIDWIEEREGKLFGYEFKYSEKRFKAPKEFLSAYPGSSVAVVNPNNYLEFIGISTKKKGLAF